MEYSFHISFSLLQHHIMHWIAYLKLFNIIKFIFFIDMFPLQEAQAYAEDNSLLFMETSAKTAMNVNETFMAIG